MFKYLRFLAFLYTAAVTPLFAQMKSGGEMQNYNTVFNLSGPSKSYSISYVGCSSPSNILFPGEQPEFQFKLKNLTKEPLVTDGKAELIPFGTKGIAGNIWMPLVYANGDAKSVPIQVNIPAGGTQDLSVKFDIPEKMGGYAIILDLGASGRQFGTSLARTYPPAAGHIPYPKMLLDANVGLDGLDRLGVGTVRIEWGFSPGDKALADRLDLLMKNFAAHHITVLMVLEAGVASKQPLGFIGRQWLGDDDVAVNYGCTDRAWLPEQDGEFRKWVTDISAKYGWPKGPITAVSLWNEPWEAGSISGWGADMDRYRTLFKDMSLGVVDARKQGTDVLITGCDSSTNTWDKLFSDGQDTFLKWLDACTIHYQGIAAPSVYKMWLNRKGPHGRVQIWDTESWVANTDDRVATIVATDRAAGYDRSMGVFHGDVTTQRSATAYDAWPLASSVGAAQHFIGEREFKHFLFPKGLPWIFVFDGLKGNVDDGTVVIAGDLGEVLGADSFPFGSVRGLKELQDKEDIKTKLASLPPDFPDRAALQKQLDEPEVLTGGLLSMPAPEHARVYDFYGNPVPLVNGQIQVPLDFRGYYLRTDGTPGSFAKLIDGLRSSRVDGYEPLNVVAHDALKPFSSGGEFKLTLGNILNRPIHGQLQVQIPGLTTDAPSELSFTPFETKEISLKISGAAREDNAYPLKLVFDAGADGKAVHEEILHVNQIAHRTIAVDGNLDDWKGVLPQSVKAKGTGAPTLTEAAWLPFKNFPQDLTAGFGTAYMAYDDHNFYFAAKVAESSPDEGTFRFETLDADQFFYPEISYEIDRKKHLIPAETVWTPANPSGVLRVSLTDPTARESKVWESGNSAGLGFVVRTPPHHATQLAIYLVDPAGGSSADGSVVQIVDEQSGKILVRQEVAPPANGVYAVFDIKGSVHVTIRGGKGNPVGVGGLFLDAAADQNPANPIAARFVSLDAQTAGEWPDKYGKVGQWLAGSPAQFPKEFAVDGGPLVEHRWPEGVRRFTYRKDSVTPSGNNPNFDNVQLAFNVLPQEDKITVLNPPGAMPGFVPVQDTDYEFALNKVAEKYGGGTEIWRLRVPGMPTKNFYPREPASPKDGAVKKGKLVVRYDGNTRLVEAAIPWSEIPEVKAAADAGRSIKFTFRVNDNKGIAMELAEGRSVSKLNPHTFHAEWAQHWGNEVEFGFEK